MLYSFISSTSTADKTLLSRSMSGSTSVSYSYSQPGQVSLSSGTSTYSMSLGLAQSLHERGAAKQDVTRTAHQKHSSPRKLTAPPRYSQIVTETMSEATRSRTEAIYTNAGVYTRFASTSATASAGQPKGDISGKNDPEKAYMSLVDKVKDVGLNAILRIAKKSGLEPVKLDPTDVGLNTVMSLKRNQSRVPDRAMAEKASQTIVYAQTSRTRGRIPPPTSAEYQRIVSSVLENVRSPSKITTHAYGNASTMLTNSTQVAMATTVVDVSKKVANHRKKSNLDLDGDMEDIKTLPSIIISPSQNSSGSPPAVRPKSLDLSPPVSQTVAMAQTEDNKEGGVFYKNSMFGNIMDLCKAAMIAEEESATYPTEDNKTSTPKTMAH